MDNDTLQTKTSKSSSPKFVLVERISSSKVSNDIFQWYSLRVGNAIQSIVNITIIHDESFKSTSCTSDILIFLSNKVLAGS